MKTFSAALVVVASLATAANASALTQDDCRGLSNKAQTMANRFDEMAKHTRGLNPDYSGLPKIGIDVDPAVLANTETALAAIIEAMTSYRDAMDALAAEFRACRPAK